MTRTGAPPRLFFLLCLMSSDTSTHIFGRVFPATSPRGNDLRNRDLLFSVDYGSASHCWAAGLIVSGTGILRQRSRCLFIDIAESRREGWNASRKRQQMAASERRCMERSKSRHRKVRWSIIIPCGSIADLFVGADFQSDRGARGPNRGHHSADDPHQAENKPCLTSGCRR